MTGLLCRVVRFPAKYAFTWSQVFAEKEFRWLKRATEPSVALMIIGRKLGADGGLFIRSLETGKERIAHLMLLPDTWPW
jgi:hypothetical protein